MAVQLGFQNWARELVRRLLPSKLRRAIDKWRNRDRVDEVQLVRRFLPMSSEKRVMVDVGAHHGESLEEFALEGWEIYAFEPDDENRRVLQERVARYSSVTVDARALSDREQLGASFFRSDVSTGISGLSAFHDTHRCVGSVDVTTLGDIIRTHEIASIDFLKIDTEGHDLEVLRGIPWDTIQPATIVCEFEDRKTKMLGYTFADMGHYLTNRGYHVIVSEWYPIVEYGCRHQWRRFALFPCELRDTRAWGNFIAIRDAETFARLADYLECPTT